MCHRLDFRVCGPVLVATAEETMSHWELKTLEVEDDHYSILLL